MQPSPESTAKPPPTLSQLWFLALLGVGNQPADRLNAKLPAAARLADLAGGIAAHDWIAETLRITEEDFRRITQNLREVFWLGALDWSAIHYISPAYELIWGEKAENLYAHPRRWMDSIVEEDRAATLAALPKVIPPEPSLIVFPDYRIRRPDGTLAWISARAFPVRDADGQPYRMAGIAEDITQRKAAERALRESEAKFATAFRHSPVAMAIRDLEDHRYLEVNDRCLEMTGYRRDEVIGRTPLEIGWMDAGDRARNEQAMLHAGGADECELRLRRKDGQPIVCTYTSHPVMIGGRRCLLSCTIDVTERQRAEAAIRENEERYRSMFHNNHAVMLLLDPRDGTIVDANPAAARFYGWTQEELRRKRITEINVLPPAEVAAEMARTQTADASHFFFQHRLADGTIRDVEVFSGRVAMHARDYLFSIVFDITKRRKAEAALWASEQRLQAVWEQSIDGMRLTDAEGRIIAVNEAYCRLVGMKRAELEGQCFTAAYETEGGRPADEILARYRERFARREIPARMERQMVFANGRTIELEVANSFIEVSPGHVAILGLFRDVTARKESEASLRASEQRYRTIVENCNDGIFIHDFQGVILEVNSSACRMLGYAREELLGATLAKIDSAEDARCRPARIAQLQQDGKIVFEGTHVRKDGACVPVEVSASLVSREGAGMIQGFARNITDRKTAVAQLEHARDLLSYIVEHDRACVAVHDRDLRYIYVSQHYLDEYQIADRNIIGKHHYEVFPDLPQKWRDVHQRALSGEVLSAEDDPYQRADGSITWTRWECRPWYQADRTIGGIIVYTEVINRRKEAELALRRSEERFRQVSMISSDFVYSCTQDANGDFALDWLAGAVERITGCSEAELLARRCWRHLVVDEDGPLFRAHVVGLQPGKTGNCELRLRRADGTTIRVASHARCTADPLAPDGIRLYGSLTDITQAKQLETQYLRAQRLETLGSLASGVAHDLNNVFTPIMMSVGLLRGIARQPHDLELVRLLEDCAKRGSSIIRQLLQFGRGREGTADTLRPAAVIDEMWRIMQETFPKSIALARTVPADLSTIRADPTQMHQVLLNLCVNARDAMPGGGKLSLTARNVHVDEALALAHLGAQTGPHVVIQVADTGGGIPPDLLERIFEPFFTTKPTGQGTGLGLPTVLDIARRHGGFITVDSVVDRGSVFSVYLPAAVGAAETFAAAPAVGGSKPSDDLVLLIDDELTIRSVAERALQRSGYRVLTAGDGRSGVALLSAWRAEARLVVTDMMMPGIDGLETIRLLRAIEPQIPIVAVSGVPSFHRELAKLPPPAIHFLEKPFSVDALLAAVRGSLGVAATGRPPADERNEPVRSAGAPG